MSPMKNPKLSVAASTTKKPKTTFSRFINTPRGGPRHLTADQGTPGSSAQPGSDRRARALRLVHQPVRLAERGVGVGGAVEQQRTHAGADVHPCAAVRAVRGRQHLAHTTPEHVVGAR